MKKTLLLTLLVSVLQLSAQTEVTFESFGLSTDEFMNDAGGDGGFSAGNLFLPNTYDAGYNFWSGWAISATTDVATPGFTNDLSAITGGGYDGTITYATSFAGGEGSKIILTGAAVGGQVDGLYLTNSTYAYLSMLEGDGFAKKFGGETGDDPDFFLLSVKGYRNGTLTADSIDFYLADYRFEDNGQDYIVDAWTWLDLKPLGNVDSLNFSLSSSDVGMFGMNTPAYFCVDNVRTVDMPSAVNSLIDSDLYSISPNPFVQDLSIQWDSKEGANVTIYSMSGQAVFRRSLTFGTNDFLLGHLPEGEFVAKIESDGKIAGAIILKR